MAWPEASPVDLEAAILDAENPLVDGLVHCFAGALASTDGLRDFVTDLVATTAAGVIDIAVTDAGDAYRAADGDGFVPASSVENLADEITVLVAAAPAAAVGGATAYGHYFGQHPAWFLSNQNTGESRRAVVSIDGVERNIAFDDAAEVGENVLVYVTRYDGAQLSSWQDGININTSDIAGAAITSQDDTHTRVGAYWGDDTSFYAGGDIVLAMLWNRALSQAEILNISTDPWQIFIEEAGEVSLVVADANHAHTVDAVNLIQANLLAIADASHAHAVDAVVLVQTSVLSVADAIHASAVDAVALTQAHLLAVADALHAHSADDLSLSQAFSLAIADAAHAHSIEAVSLSQGQLLALQDALHSTSADQLALISQGVLVISDALHAHLVDNLVMGGGVFRVGDRLMAVRHGDRVMVVVPSERFMAVRH